jgi:hypothetical protein
MYPPGFAIYITLDFLGRLLLMPKKQELVVVEPTKLDLLTKEEAALISKEIVNVREEVQDCPYLGEALKVLPVRGYGQRTPVGQRNITGGRLFGSGGPKPW